MQAHMTFTIRSLLKLCSVFRVQALKEVGIDWLEGPPVPIPNTEVKLKFVDDSMRVTACENR